MAEQDTIDWLMVWVRGAGLGEHATPSPGQFLRRLATAAYDTFDQVMARRITSERIDQQLTELRVEVARAAIASLPDPLVERYQDDDPDLRLAVMTVIFLWTLDASDALLLPRENLDVWRYRLNWTTAQARDIEVRAAAV